MIQRFAARSTELESVVHHALPPTQQQLVLQLRDTGYAAAAVVVPVDCVAGAAGVAGVTGVTGVTGVAAVG